MVAAGAMQRSSSRLRPPYGLRRVICWLRWPCRSNDVQAACCPGRQAAWECGAEGCGRGPRDVRGELTALSAGPGSGYTPPRLAPTATDGLLRQAILTTTGLATAGRRVFTASLRCLTLSPRCGRVSSLALPQWPPRPPSVSGGARLPVQAATSCWPSSETMRAAALQAWSIPLTAGLHTSVLCHQLASGRF